MEMVSIKKEGRLIGNFDLDKISIRQIYNLIHRGFKFEKIKRLNQLQLDDENNLKDLI